MVSKKLITIISVGFLIIVIFWIRLSIEKKNALALMMPRETVATVEAEKAVFKPMPHKLTTVGVLKANQMVVIKPDTNGYVEKIMFQEGAYVAENTPLIVLENSSQNADYLMASAELTSNKSIFNRINELLKKGVATKKDYDKAFADMKMAEAKVAQTKSRLEKTIIKAPFSGYVSLHDISVGAYVTHGQEGLLTIVDSTPMKVEFSVSELYLKQLRLNQEIVISVESHGTHPIKATIEAIDAKVDPLNHSVMVRAVIDEKINHLRPGQFATVKVEVGHTGNVVQIPDISIEVRGDQSYVYRVIQGRAVRTRVVLGPREAGYVQVVDGIRENDWVITAGQVKVREDEKVKVINSGYTEDLEPMSSTVEQKNASATEQNPALQVQQEPKTQGGADKETVLNKTEPVTTEPITTEPVTLAESSAESATQTPETTSANGGENISEAEKKSEDITVENIAKQVPTTQTTLEKIAANPVLLAENN